MYLSWDKRDGLIYLFFFFLLLEYIALQSCVSFCCTSQSESATKVKSESFTHSVMSNSLRPYGLQPTRLLYPWTSPGNNTEVGCHSLLQRVFLTQGSNLGFQHYRQILYRLSHQGISYMYTYIPSLLLLLLLLLLLSHFSRFQLCATP